MEQAGGYDFRADIWSLGITALELAKGVAPYAQYSAMKVLVLTIEEEPPSLRTYPTGTYSRYLSSLSLLLYFYNTPFFHLITSHLIISHHTTPHTSQLCHISQPPTQLSGDRQRTGLPFSKSFEDFITKCLQKNPRHRPGTEELLKHKFFKNRSCYALVDQLLNLVPSVGGRAANTNTNSGVSTGGAVGGGGGGVSAMTEEVARVRLPGESPIAIEVESEVAAINDAAELRQLQQQQQGQQQGQGQNNLSLPLPVSSNMAQPLPQTNHNHDSNPPAVPPRQYVAGTTWVFDDDSSSSVGGGGSSSSGGGSFSNSRGDP